MAEAGKIRTNLEYALARMIIDLFTLLPLRTAIRFGSAVGRLGFRSSKLRRAGMRNLELAFPDLSADDRTKLLRGCFENFGRLLGVVSHFGKETPEKWKEVIDCEGLQQLAKLRSQNQSIILFTGHVGAWELTSYGLSLFDRPLSFLVRRLDNPKVERLVDRFRTSRGNRTIDKMFAAREMLQILQSGGTLGILVDLNTLDREAVFVDFFGVKAATTFVVAKLALRTGAALLPVFAPWDETKNKFRLEVGARLPIDRTNDEAADILRLTQVMTGVVEDYVRRFPDQWLWVHRRWRTRPAGEPEIY